MTATETASMAHRLANAGLLILRYSLALLLLLFGALKWTPAEAESLRPWISHSPLLSWLYQAASVQNASIVIGAIEIAIGAAILSRRWLPMVCAAGSAAAIGMFLITLSFLVTTPSMDAGSQGFLMKDVFSLGIAVWSTGEAFAAAHRGIARV